MSSVIVGCIMILATCRALGAKFSSCISKKYGRGVVPEVEVERRKKNREARSAIDVYDVAVLSESFLISANRETWTSRPFADRSPYYLLSSVVWRESAAERSVVEGVQMGGSKQ